MTRTSLHSLFPEEREQLKAEGPTGGLFTEAPPPPSFDGARQDWPSIGLAIYALDPDGPVTLEVHSDGQVYRFDAATAAEALMLAFPPRSGDVFG